MVDLNNFSPAGRNRWLSPILVESKIKTLHSNGFQVFCHVPTDYVWSSLSPVGIPLSDIIAMINHQMVIGPSIDGFFFDVTPNFYGEWGQYRDPPAPIPQKYIDLHKYVKGLGKIQVNNSGSPNVGPFAFEVSDYVCNEHYWKEIATNYSELFKANFGRWTGFSPENNSDPVFCARQTKEAFDLGYTYFGPHQPLCSDPHAWKVYCEELSHILPVIPPEPPPRTVVARFPCVGNRALVQVYLRKLRDKIFSKKQHERLHPWI